MLKTNTKFVIELATVGLLAATHGCSTGPSKTNKAAADMVARDNGNATGTGSLDALLGGIDVVLQSGNNSLVGKKVTLTATLAQPASNCSVSSTASQPSPPPSNGTTATQVFGTTAPTSTLGGTAVSGNTGAVPLQVLTAGQITASDMIGSTANVNYPTCIGTIPTSSGGVSATATQTSILGGTAAVAGTAQQGTLVFGSTAAVAIPANQTPIGSCQNLTTSVSPLINGSLQTVAPSYCICPVTTAAQITAVPINTPTPSSSAAVNSGTCPAATTTQPPALTLNLIYSANLTVPVANLAPGSYIITVVVLDDKNAQLAGGTLNVTVPQTQAQALVINLDGASGAAVGSALSTPAISAVKGGT